MSPLPGKRAVGRHIFQPRPRFGIPGLSRPERTQRRAPSPLPGTVKRAIQYRVATGLAREARSMVEGIYRRGKKDYRMTFSKHDRVSKLGRLYIGEGEQTPEAVAARIRRAEGIYLQHFGASGRGTKSRSTLSAQYNPKLMGAEESRFNKIFMDHELFAEQILPKRFGNLLRMLNPEQKEVLIELITRINYGEQQERYIYTEYYKEFFDLVATKNRSRLKVLTDELTEHFIEEAQKAAAQG